jgi:hypothetical protein
MPSRGSRRPRSRPPWRRKPSRYTPPEVKLLWEQALDGELTMEQAIELARSKQEPSERPPTEDDEPDRESQDRSD